MVALDPGATALFFGGLTFPWSFYSDALADLDTMLAAHPGPAGSGSCFATGPVRWWPWSPPSAPGARW